MTKRSDTGPAPPHSGSLRSDREATRVPGSRSATNSRDIRRPKSSTRSRRPGTTTQSCILAGARAAIRSSPAPWSTPCTTLQAHGHTPSRAIWKPAPEGRYPTVNDAYRRRSGAPRRAGLRYGPPHLTTAAPMSGASAGEPDGPTGYPCRGGGADTRAARAARRGARGAQATARRACVRSIAGAGGRAPPLDVSGLLASLPEPFFHGLRCEEFTVDLPQRADARRGAAAHVHVMGEEA